MIEPYERVFSLPHPAGRYEGQGTVYMAAPPDAADAPRPLLLALHGSGRDALCYRDVPFYRMQREIALLCGYRFAAVSNGPDAFGLDDGLANVEALYDWIGAHYPGSPCTALWATSAGGLMMHRFYRRHPGRVSLLLGIFPIFDPLAMPPLPSMLRAFGAPDEAALRRITAALGLVPKAALPGTYRGVRVVVAHGRGDAAVPIAQSRALRAQVLRDGGQMTLIETTGGHSTENFALYRTDAFREALLHAAKT